MRSLESPIIDLISTFLAKHDKSEKVVRFKCGHVKGDPNHIEAQNSCGGDIPVDTDLGSLPNAGSSMGPTQNRSTAAIASTFDTSGSAAQSVQSTATSDLGSLSGYERALAVDD